MTPKSPSDSPTTNNIDLMHRIRDRQRGCLWGLAIGDALGAAIEFSPPGTFKPVTAYRGGGPFGLAPGEWTDDTSMALALADSLANADWDLNDQASRYVQWWSTGKYSVNGTCFDIGITTQSALRRFQQLRDATQSGSREAQASGNGSIMRLAPVPIRYGDLYPTDVVRLAHLAAESSLTTHASDLCLSACRYMAVVLAGLMHDVPRDEALSDDWEPLRSLRAASPLHPTIDKIAAGSFRRKNPPEIRGTGFVADSLEACLWAFHSAADFEEAVLKAVNLGDDSDTTGAVCGQFAGAYWGYEQIPASLRQGLAKSEMIEAAFVRLVDSRSRSSNAGK